MSSPLDRPSARTAGRSRTSGQTLALSPRRNVRACGTERSGAAAPEAGHGRPRVVGPHSRHMVRELAGRG
jgi:hypothetical protein